MLLVLRRLPLLVALLAAISAAVFALTQYLPGDPAFVAAGGGDATPEMVAAARARLGLDRPLWVRYLYYMRNVAGQILGEREHRRRDGGEQRHQERQASEDEPHVRASRPRGSADRGRRAPARPAR